MIHGLVALRCYEVTIQLFRVVDPAGAENLKCICFIGIILAEEPDILLLLVLIPQVASKGILVFKDGVLDWLGAEWLVTMDFHLSFLSSNPIF